MPYNYPAVGALYQKDHTTFTVWAPLHEQVELVLQENHTHSLQKDERGYWSVTLPGIQPNQCYQYRVNGQLLPDPASRCQPDGVHGASAVTDPAFAWQDEDWKGLALGDMILYELHTGTFTAAHTFDGIAQRLDYLQQLGINTIEIMPVGHFPGNRNWGYDGVFPFAVHTTYGGVQGLKQLVNAAHRRGIAVVLDVVYNHQGPDGNYFEQYAPYFTDKYKTWWGKAINFDDAWSDGVRHYYWQNALMWLDEFHIDGLRIDAVHAIWDNSAHHFIKVLKEKVAALEARTGCKKVLIAEFDLNNPRYITPLEQNGYGLDGQWIDEFHHALHAVITGEVNGYYEDFGHLQHLAKSLRDSYVYTGEYSIHRKKTFGVLPANNPYSQFVVFAQNHDQIGNRLLGDRLTQTLSYEQLKLVAATVLLSPHVPLLFMGEEYGEKNSFQFFIDHTDPALVEVVRKGRKEEFSYFNWAGEVPDPQSVATFEACVLSWSYEHDAAAATLLAYYTYLIAFRKQRIAMQGKGREHVTVWEPTLQLVCFERHYENDRVLIVLNFSNEAVAFATPNGQLMNVLFDSSAQTWNGPGEQSNGMLASNYLLHPYSAVIFE